MFHSHKRGLYKAEFADGSEVFYQLIRAYDFEEAAFEANDRATRNNWNFVNLTNEKETIRK